MKPIKIVGPAALAALMVLALVGASPAMAENTALCAADESPCAAGNQVTHVHEVTLAGVPALLLTNFGNIKCEVLFLSTSVGALASPQIIRGNYTYTNCKRKKLVGEENCTVVEVNGPAESTVLKEGHETATVATVMSLKATCGSLINCEYGWAVSSPAKGPLLSSETNGSVTVTENAPFVTKGLCPGENELDITTTPLNPTYISS